MNKSLVFGQAKIFANKKLYWYFPGKNLKNIARDGLNILSQIIKSMLISKSLANKYDFPKISILSLMDIGKEKLKNACDVIYVKKPLIKFFLDGVSSINPLEKS